MNKPLPTSATAFGRHKKGFQAWLVQNGSEVFAPTSQYELLRFRGVTGISIVYTKATGGLTWTNGANEAFRAFQLNWPWRAGRATPRKQAGAAKRANLFQTLRERDGDGCLYCRRPVPLDEFSLEHIVSATHGGPNHLANYAITHAACNGWMNHLSAAEKLRAVLHTEASR